MKRENPDSDSDDGAYAANGPDTAEFAPANYNRSSVPDTAEFAPANYNRSSVPEAVMPTNKSEAKKCTRRTVSRDVNGNFSREPWCRIQDSNKMKELVGFMSGKTKDKPQIDDVEYMKLLGIPTAETKYKALGISPFLDGRVKTDKQLEAEVWQKKQTGEYDRIFGTAATRAQEDPNTLCYLTHSLLPQNKYTKGWQVVKVLGQGKYGVALLMQKNLQQRAIKLMIANPEKDFMTPEEEASMQELAASWGMAPDVVAVKKYMSPSGNNMFMIVMGLVDFDLETYINCIIANNFKKAELEQRLQQIINALKLWFLKAKAHTLTHSDPHVGNVCLRYLDRQNSRRDDNRYAVKGEVDLVELLMIDFGQSSAQVWWPEIDASQLIRSLRQEYSNSNPDIYSFLKKGINKILLELRGKDYKAITGSDDEFMMLAKQIDKYMGLPKNIDIKRLVRKEKANHKKILQGRVVKQMGSREGIRDPGLRRSKTSKHKVYSHSRPEREAPRRRRSIRRSSSAQPRGDTRLGARSAQPRARRLSQRRPLSGRSSERRRHVRRRNKQKQITHYPDFGDWTI